MIIRCTSQEYITNWWQYSFNQINWNKRFLHEYKFKKLVSSNHRAVIGVDITWTYQNCDLWIVSRRREINYSITLQQLQLPTWDGNARSKQAREKRRITRWTAPPPLPPPHKKIIINNSVPTVALRSAPLFELNVASQWQLKRPGYC